MVWDSSLAYRTVPAASNEQGPRPGGYADVRGIVVHMAEGGGTVSWLTRPDGNSSHYVVEYDGRIVQMVRESWWAGSINPTLLRKTDDSTFKSFQGESVTYGRTAAVHALGTTAANDPNRYVIAIETEGFAATGPNAAQRAALSRLVADIRRRRGKPLPVLGHRDFQSYKACPGKRIPWLDYGGHAVKSDVGAVLPDTGTSPSEDPMQQFAVYTTPREVTIPKGTVLYDNDALAASSGNIIVDPARDMPYVGTLSSEVGMVGYIPTGDVPSSTHVYFVKLAVLGAFRPIEPEPVPDTTPFSQADIDAAVAEARNTDAAQLDDLESQVATLSAKVQDLTAEVAGNAAARTAMDAWRAFIDAAGNL